MAGFRRLSKHFQKSRKKNGSSRSLAMKAKKSLTSASDGQVNSNKELVVETCNKNTERLYSSPRSATALLNAVGKFMQQCQHRISQMLPGFCSVLFFWRVYAQRVEILHQKVEELQKELQLLRNNALLPPEPRCSGCHGTTFMHHHQHSSVALHPSQQPPLCPPPPPPPPPLPPPIPVPQRLPFVPKRRTSHSSLQDKVDRHVTVTLKDLQAVKLRKVTANNKVWISPDGKRAPLVTLSDLQKVRLRRVQCSTLSAKRRSSGRSPSKSPMKLHLQLRKVHIDRTPSDTPLSENKENVEKHSHISAVMGNVLENNSQGVFPVES
ncbi:hypothetical protein KOW79_013796 [Hemibagrus wyckioides]|uniref:Proline rich 11 n=1 Tax=Hemibagrus wyckioides TaxID=337641 RepID=A0A9D3NHZ1_9TELE|nr:proline-rich protein 11 [Hemibagrus wyckioides]KAG7322450.1 hypothetical protein KOW79_013796 [Hemibagrus wyckioides]